MKSRTDKILARRAIIKGVSPAEPAAKKAAKKKVAKKAKKGAE